MSRNVLLSLDNSNLVCETGFLCCPRLSQLIGLIIRKFQKCLKCACRSIFLAQKRKTMKLTFWLLDVNYEVKDGTPALWLWGIDAFAERVLIVDRSFLAYFYAVMEEHADPVKIVESVENEQYESIIKLEVVGRKFFGKTVKAVKVYCRNPDEISKCSRDLRAFEGIKECFEDDIRYSMRLPHRQ